MNKKKVLRLFIICAFSILMILKFYVTFKKGVAESTLINKDNSDLLLIGEFLSACVLIFGTTIACERKRSRSIIIGLGILGMILHLVLLLVVALT